MFMTMLLGRSRSWKGWWMKDSVGPSPSLSSESDSESLEPELTSLLQYSTQIHSVR